MSDWLKSAFGLSSGSTAMFWLSFQVPENDACIIQLPAIRRVTARSMLVNVLSIG